MEKGGGWNFATKDSALMCFLDFFSMNRNSAFIWSAQENLVRLDAESLAAINQKLLVDELTRKVIPYPYGTIDEEPRQLSDEEIAGLIHRPAGYVKSMISTVSDAIAYLDLRFPQLWMGMTVDNGIDTQTRWHRSAVEILSSKDVPASRVCVVNYVNYLLSDNYEIDSLIAFWPDPNVLNEDGPQKGINAIKTSDGYLFFDPVLWMQGDSISRQGSLLPEKKCSSIAEYVETIRQTPALADEIKYIFKNSDGSRMDFVCSFTNGYTIETGSPGLEVVYYSVPAKEPGLDIKPENIGKYKISTLLGGVTLTPDEARVLVDATPEVVREEVQTAADVLMYMLAARIGDSKGCKCTPVDGHTWHWNMSAKEVMETKLGNCGSCANLANYLLDGDYEEVGYIDQAYYPGDGGSHVYTYILHEGKYYILDYSSYIFNNYEPTRDYGISVLNSLAQWPEKIQWIYGPVCLVMSYDTPGMQYPVIFGDEYTQEFGDTLYILPEGAAYTVLYEAPDGYKYHHISFDTRHYDWNVFWED